MKSIFEKLEEFNIYVKADKRHFPWFAVFDLESILVPFESTANDSNRRGMSKENVWHKYLA